jgi:hypothetical protein
MNGKKVINSDQLINGQCYVACNKERFKKIEYFPPSDFNVVSPKQARKS